MCYRPIKMYNPTKDFTFTDSYKIDVPCNQCEDCRNVKRLEWQFRIQEELMHCSSKGYNCYFGTLTYNDISLPTYEILDDFGDVVDVVPCFSRDDISEFITALRHSLYNKYKVKDSSFIICCEYGSHTQRPHYHFLLCVDSKVAPYELHKLIKDLWSENGFLFPRYVYGGIDSHGYTHRPFKIDNLLSASSYTSKYVCKDLSYIESFPSLVAHREHLRRLYKADPIEENEQNYKECNRSFPFIRVSKGFGACINYKVESVNDVLNGVINISTGKLTKLPAYNMRKLLYNVHYINLEGRKVVRYTPNELGVEYLEAVTSRKIESLVSQFKEFVKDVNGTDFKEYCNNFCLDYKTESLFVKDFVKKANLKDIAVYNACFRNKVLPDYVLQVTSSEVMTSDLLQIPSDIDYFTEYGVKFCNGHIKDLRLVNDKITKTWLRSCSQFCFNTLECFQGYDRFIESFTNYRNYLKGNKAYFKAIEEEQRKKVKQMFTHIDY